MLPYVNLNPDERNEYFSDGLTEEVITRLAAVPGLKVISRTSAMHYKGTRKPLLEIAGELRVAHILEGSVRRTDGRVRISAQLIDAATGYHIWSRDYDREVADVLALQDEIAQAITGALELRLPARAAAPRAPRAPDPAAYDLYRREPG